MDAVRGSKGAIGAGDDGSSEREVGVWIGWNDTIVPNIAGMTSVGMNQCRRTVQNAVDWTVARGG